jgi:hypothetical protein
MGSSKSKPRKGHKKGRHLAKVGSPANLQHEHEAGESMVFGSGMKPVLLVVLLGLVVIGLLVLTL